MEVAPAPAPATKHVEMRNGDGGEIGGLENATEAPPEAKHSNQISDHSSSPHVMNGHLTPDDKGAKEASSSPKNHVDDQPLPSVEKDEDRSPSTAAAEHEKTPESDRREAVQSSPAQPRHRDSASGPVPTTVQTATETAESLKVEREIARLNEVLQETSAQAAQKVLRDKWRFFIFDQYDEAHISFILRAGFKNANPSVTEKVLKDNTLFKELLLDVASKKSPVIEKVITNATPDQLLRHTPQRIIDEALAERLKTVSAKQLISWLARADRLGYKMDDIIDEDDESVVPRAESVDVEMAEVFEVEPPPRFASTQRDPLLAEQEKNLAAQRAAVAKTDAMRRQQQEQLHQQQQQRAQPQARPPGELSCPLCHVTFPTMSGYVYHTTKKPCLKQPKEPAKWWCENCIQGFTTKQGMDYHKLKKVCSGDDIAPATSPSKQLQQEAASQAQYRPPPAQVPSQPQVHLPSIPRSSFTSQSSQGQPLPAGLYGPSYHAQREQQSRPQVSIQRPPLHTPSHPTSTPPSVSTPGPRKQAPPSDVRQSPSELSQEALAALNKELEDADARYAQQIAEIPKTYTEAERNARLVSLKNANASRKSQIRKSHGVSLRLREKDKLARKIAGVSPSGKATPENRTPLPSMTTIPPSTSTPPVSSFSPINTPPPRTGSSPSDYGHNGNPPHPSVASQYNPHSSSSSQTSTSRYPANPVQPQRTPYAAHPTATTTTYRPPPLNASVRVQSQYMTHDPNTLSHALERPGPRPSGFGVLRVQDLANNPVPTTSSSNQNATTGQKRRRSIDDEGRPHAGPPPYRAQVVVGERERERDRGRSEGVGVQKMSTSTLIEILSSEDEEVVDRPSKAIDPTAATPEKERGEGREGGDEGEGQGEKDKEMERVREKEKESTEPENRVEREVGEKGEREREREREKEERRGSTGGRGRGFMAKRGGHH